MNDDKTKIVSKSAQVSNSQSDNNEKTRLSNNESDSPLSPSTSDTSQPSNFSQTSFLSDLQADDKTLTTGDIIKERFVLESAIAKGGMGIVYKAKDLRKEEARDKDPYIAIKVLSEEFKKHPDALISLQRETKKAQLLAHPNVVTVHDFDRDENQVYMTMEYLEGKSLEEVIKNNRNTGLQKEKALSMIKGMASGLAYAHKKHIIHSDFKPGNVFYTNDNVIKILDFGIARAMKKRTNKPEQDETIFDPGTLGALTPAYASCEMLEYKDPDPRDDIYALACVAYELLTGRHPYNRLTALQARENNLQPQPAKALDKHQWQALNKALSLHKEQRTKSVDEFLDQLFNSKWSSLYSTKNVLGVVAILMAIALATSLLLKYSDNTADTPSFTEIEELPLDPTLQPEVDNLLDLAESFLLFGRLSDPPGSNAFEAYEKVLELHPTNRKAYEGLAIIAEQYFEQAKGHIEKGNRKKAAAFIDRGLQVMPEHADLLKLKEDLQ